MIYKLGDKFTIDGHYKRRTLWQWLRREPRVLKQYVVKAVFESFCE